MKPVTHVEEEIFSAAIALPPTEREEYLASHCGEDSAIRQRVRELIDGYERNSAFLERPAASNERLNIPGFPGSLPPEANPGDQIGAYRIRERIGEGGFGVVYLADQTAPVRRRVALKLIRLGLDTREFIARFADERQALALMEHPNIARVFDAGATEAGRPYLVMEFIPGTPITRYCDEHYLTLRERLTLFLQVCGAIQHAHQKGVIHRDLKPSNILVTDEAGEPIPKLIDFGIAKAVREPLTEHTVFTRQHVLIGTPAYTSPEQINTDGREADTRSDIYSLGALLYELVAGAPPFEHEKLKQLGVDELRRILREEEPSRPSARVAAYPPEQGNRVASRRKLEAARLPVELRADLDWIVMRCLEKDPSRRYATANALAMDLRRHLENEPVVARPRSRLYQLGKFIRRHRFSVVTGATIIGVIVAGSIIATMQSLRAQRAELLAMKAQRAAEMQERRLEKIHWARETALPEISRLLKKNDAPAAFVLAQQAAEFLPDDPVLASFWPLISVSGTVETTPAGADIYAKPYNQPGAKWQYLGKSPLTDVKLPRAVHRWRIERAGYTPVERSDAMWSVWEQRRVASTLFETARTPVGMVRVAERDSPFLKKMEPPLDDFWIDRHEVTNREFKEFVAGGGYAKEEFWKIPFVRDGETLRWSDAMTLFRDRTGQPGPAGWANGTYLENEADYPVTGVSWFEAAAYAEFVGKRLPSVHHWRRAARKSEGEYLLDFANFGSNGPATVGASQGISWCGAVDLAGNAKEWCWNEAPGGRRYLLGGGWRDPAYMFMNDDALSPFDRGPQNGFRCIQIDPGTTVPEAVDAFIPRRLPRDYASEKPVTDEQFAFVKRAYAYDRTNLDPRSEGAAMENDRWRRERVSFNTAYSSDRMDALIYFPKSARPPYQVVVFFPGSGAQLQHSSDNPVDIVVVETLLATRRVVVYPILLGTFERPLSPDSRTPEVREMVWRRHAVQDVRRTIDYLETRSDLQLGKVAYVGFSWGAAWGPIVAALEDRIKVNVFIAGGFSDGKGLPEADPFNFAPRVTAPTLMINGRQDFIYLPETSQRPLFRALGTPAEHKRHLLVEGGHGLSVAQAAGEINEWLDRYLGPVAEGGR